MWLVPVQMGHSVEKSRHGRRQITPSLLAVTRGTNPLGELRDEDMNASMKSVIQLDSGVVRFARQMLAGSAQAISGQR